MIKIIINTPILLITCGILLISLTFFLIYSKPVLSQCRNLDLRHKSPLITTLSTTIQGVLTLRVFNQVSNYYKRFVSYANDSLQASWVYYYVTRAFGAHIQIFTTLILIAGLFIMISLDSDPGKIGQTIIYSIIMVDSLQWLLRQVIQLEVFMGSAQRCINFIHNPQEDKLEKDIKIEKF
jgi:ABC-type transport system involved in cytochrome bd biosynthesis fused ATPase/permease subunit